MFQKPVSLLGRLLLWTLSWKPLDIQQIAELRRSPRCIIIFPHTSYWDFFLFVCYYLAHPEVFGQIHTIMYGGYYKPFAWILKHLNIIPTKSGGFVADTVSVLSKKKDFLLALSPEGSTSKQPWKSGYYHLARELKCPIRIMGADFEFRLLRICPVRDIDGMTREEIEPILQKDMAMLVPLYPDESYVQVRSYHQDSITLYSLNRLIEIWNSIGFALYFSGWIRMSQIVTLIMILLVYLELSQRHYRVPEPRIVYVLAFWLYILNLAILKSYSTIFQLLIRLLIHNIIHEKRTIILGTSCSTLPIALAYLVSLLK